jgi:hypothetical protein
MTEDEKSISPFNEAGRRLKAALISYQLGYSGVDYTLKQMPQVVDPSWSELPERLLREMSEQIGSSLFPKGPPGIHSGID